MTEIREGREGLERILGRGEGERKRHIEGTFCTEGRLVSR